MPVARALTAYGVSARGSGYSTVSAACANAAGGSAVQLLATAAATPVFAYVDSGDVDEKVYLAKVSTIVSPSNLYGADDGYVAGQIVYVTAQAIGGNMGTITTAGYYTIGIDTDFANSAYITTLVSTNQITQPTVCPAEPVAEFTGVPTTVLALNKVVFTDGSENTPTSWQWDFPGGTPNESFLENPTITYTIPGVYDVTLEATNAEGDDTEEKNDYITVTWQEQGDETGSLANVVSSDYVINTYKHMSIQRTRTTDQIPFFLGTKGPLSLRTSGSTLPYSSSIGSNSNKS